MRAAERDAAWLDCLEVADDAARLDCYDALAHEVRQQRDAGPAIAPTQAAAPAPPSAASVPPPVEPESVTGRITAVGATARGNRVITLDTGHRFVEIEPGRGRIETGTTVTVMKRPRRYVMRIEGAPDIGVRLED